MTRTTPDPVFADASRAELERRVRAARTAPQRVPQPGRRGVMQMAVTAAVAVLILSVVVGLGQLRSRWVGAPAPTIAPTATVETTPTPVPTSTPTSTPTPGSTSTSTPDPTSTPNPTSTPTSAPDPTSTPTSKPTPTSSPTTAARLIVPEGFQPRSDAQLRAWGATLPESLPSTQVWIEQQVILVHCMAGKGFLYDPEYLYHHPTATVPAGHEQAYEEALHGPASDGAYDWRTAGCDGLAVHETGQDDAN